MRSQMRQLQDDNQSNRVEMEAAWVVIRELREHAVKLGPLQPFKPRKEVAKIITKTTTEKIVKETKKPLKAMKAKKPMKAMKA